MKLIKIFIPIIILVIIISFSLKKYKEYQYYKSEEMNIITSGMIEFLRGYQINYCKYPSEGDVFIKYLKKNNEFFKTVGFAIPEIIRNKGLDIYKDSTNKRILLYSYPKNYKVNKPLQYITNVSFIEYILGANIIILEDELFDVCNWENNMNVKLFKDNDIFENEVIKKEIIKQIKLFRIRNSSIKIPIDPLSCKTFYFYGKINNKRLQFDLICDPYNGEKDVKLIVDSLNYLFNDIIIENKIDEIYLPIKVCNNQSLQIALGSPEAVKNK